MANLYALKEMAQEVRNEVKIGANTASRIGYLLEEIVTALQNMNENNGNGLSSEGKEALVACFRKCAWVDTSGEELVNDLISKLESSSSGGGGNTEGDTPGGDSGDDTGYITDGLMLWYDAIDNTRAGHSATIEAWEELTGTGFDLKAYADVAAQTPKDIVCGDDYILLDGATMLKPDRDSPLSELLASEAGTLEIVFQQDQSETGIFFISCANDSQREQSKCLWYRSNNQSYVLQSAATGSGVGISMPIVSGVQSLSKVYGGDARCGNQVISSTTEGGNMPAHGAFSVGGRYHTMTDQLPYYMTGKIMAIRYYNRALTDSERQKNYLLDKERFGAL